MITLYELLEVSEKASDEIIEKAYKTLAKRYHPDLQKTKEDKDKASERMKKINIAYDVLGNKEKRAAYDKDLSRRREIERQKEESRREQEVVQNNEINNNQNPYDNINNYNNYNNENYTPENQETGKIENWRDLLAYLTDRDRHRLIRKIEKDAQKEYKNMYSSYLEQLGYRVRPRITFKKVIIIISIILVLSLIGTIMWHIPSSHDYMVEVYKNNFLVKIVVDLVYGIFKALFTSTKHAL